MIGKDSGYTKWRTVDAEGRKNMSIGRRKYHNEHPEFGELMRTVAKKTYKTHGKSLVEAAAKVNRVKFKIRDPEGNVLEGCGYDTFCKEHGLTCGKQISAVVRGLKTSYCGYTKV